MELRGPLDRLILPGHGGNILPAYSLLHITCNCDDTDVDTILLLRFFGIFVEMLSQ
jgi:hypothetical protein